MERSGLPLEGLPHNWLSHGGSPERRHLQYTRTIHTDCVNENSRDGRVVAQELQVGCVNDAEVVVVVGSLPTNDIPFHFSGSRRAPPRDLLLCLRRVLHSLNSPLSFVSNSSHPPEPRPFHTIIMPDIELPDPEELGGNVTKPFKFVTGIELLCAMANIF